MRVPGGQDNLYRTNGIDSPRSCYYGRKQYIRRTSVWCDLERPGIELYEKFKLELTYPGTGGFPSKATRGVASIEDGGGADLTDPKDSLGINEDQEVCYYFAGRLAPNGMAVASILIEAWRSKPWTRRTLWGAIHIRSRK